MTFIRVIKFIGFVALLVAGTSVLFGHFNQSLQHLESESFELQQR